MVWIEAALVGPPIKVVTVDEGSSALLELVTFDYNTLCIRKSPLGAGETIRRATSTSEIVAETLPERG